jgi:hypothetical protein
MGAIDTIVRELGGPLKCSETLGVHFTRVYAWQRAGAFPVRRLPALVEAARRNGAPEHVIAQLTSAAAPPDAHSPDAA